MKWEKMTRRQRDAARDITERLWKAGVSGCTVSQVAKYFDESMAWDKGRMPLAELRGFLHVPVQVGDAPGSAGLDALLDGDDLAESGHGNEY